MANNSLGELRRSAVVGYFGPGAIVDFRLGNAPLSAVVAGLEEWDHRAQPQGLANDQVVHEPRLQQKLNVKGFRLPPVADERDKSDSTALSAVRFPDWLQCPECDRIRRSRSWGHKPGKPERFCAECSYDAPGQEAVYVVPVRFITACEHGHLDEFPWGPFARHAKGCTAGESELELRQMGAGLAGLMLRCAECDEKRSMEYVFSEKTLETLPCRGRRPWLQASESECGRAQRTLQRGASNLYYPIIQSALDIPPWSNHIEKQLGKYWSPLKETEPEGRRNRLQLIIDVVGLQGDLDELLKLVEDRIRILEEPERENLRRDEYAQFTSRTDSSPTEGGEFEIRQSRVPAGLDSHFGSAVRASRLREVRALTGFTRIHPPGGDDEMSRATIAPIQSSWRPWLPAIEVRGEGVFFSLSSKRLQEWESQKSVQQRAKRLGQLYAADLKRRHGEDAEADRIISARFVLLHTLAHTLMKYLALDCGYSSASLRERLYADGEEGEMAGLLIYTSTPDSDGTLGGLVRQGRSERLQEWLPAAIHSMEWCSSDPLCINGLTASSEAMNLAACHACVLAPETSCEEYNRFLDRAMLVGLPDQPEVGYFSDLPVSP